MMYCNSFDRYETLGGIRIVKAVIMLPVQTAMIVFFGHAIPLKNASLVIFSKRTNNSIGDDKNV